MKNKNKLSKNDAWSKLNEKLKIIQEIEKHGEFVLTTEQINFLNKEGSYGPDARLMTSSDSSEQRPDFFKQHDIGILPIGNRSFKLAKFNSFFPLEEKCSDVSLIDLEKIKKFETINVNKIGSEDKAILISDISNMLNEFTQENNLKLTNKGKFGVEKFDFRVQLDSKEYKKINIMGGQAELDAGFEGEQFYVIEAKLRKLADFNIRQLYYPYRYWQLKIKKPVVPVFMVYSDRIFDFWEYKFEEVDNFNSLKLVKHKKFTFEKQMASSSEDLLHIKEFVRPDDTPFPQADNFENIINLLDFVNAGISNKETIADKFEFEERQSDYYANSAKYLDLLTRTDDGFILTETGKKIVNSTRTQRHYLLARAILSRKVFYDVFLATRKRPLSNDEVVSIMKKNGINLGASTMLRRSLTVRSWIDWINKVLK